MPPVIVAVVAAAASALVSAIPAVVTALGTTGALILGAAVGAVISAAGALVIGRASKKSAPQQNLASTAQDQKVAIRGSVQPRRVIYGRQRVSGPVLYAASSGADQRYLHMVVALASHPVHSITDIWINDELIPDSAISSGTVTTGKFAGLVVVGRYNGFQTAADPTLLAESPDGWSADHKLRGIAYVYVRLEYRQELFQGAPSISALVEGKADIFDPRDNSTGYTNNWALCVMDYLMSPLGLACAGDEIDATNFIAAANLSDEDVPLDAAGTLTQKRYTCDGSFTLDRAPIDIMDDMLLAGGGALLYVAGQYRLRGGAYTAPSGTLTVSDLAGPVRVETKPPRAELFNAVKGTFIDPSRFWQPSEFAPLTDATYEAEDGERIWRDVEFPFVIDNTRAQRLARMLLKRARAALTIEATVRYSGIAWSVWDVLAVTLPDFGWSAKPFRIVAWSFSPAEGTVSLTLQEEQSSSYSWFYDLADDAPDVPSTTLVSPLSIPAPTGLTITPTTQQQADGSVAPALLVTWTASAHPFVSAYEVQWRPTGWTDWNSLTVQGGTTRAVIAPVIINWGYDVRVRAVATLARSAWTAVGNGTGAPDTTAPDVPTSIVATGAIKGISLSWVMPTAPDLAAVEIWENTSSSYVGFYWVGETRGAGWFRGGLPTNTTRWYWLRSRDLSGNLSVFVGPVSATSSYLLTDDIGNAVLNTAKFAQSIKPVEFGTALPAAGGYTDGDYFYVQPTDPTAAGTLYKIIGGAWSATEGGQPVEFPKVIAGQIRAAAINTRELAAGSVKADKLAVEELIAYSVQVRDLIVGTRKFEPGSVSGVEDVYADWGFDLTTGVPKEIAYRWYSVPDTGGGAVRMQWFGSYPSQFVTYEEVPSGEPGGAVTTYYGTCSIEVYGPVGSGYDSWRTITPGQFYTVPAGIWAMRIMALAPSTSVNFYTFGRYLYAMYFKR